MAIAILEIFLHVIIDRRWNAAVGSAKAPKSFLRLLYVTSPGTLGPIGDRDAIAEPARSTADVLWEISGTGG